MASGGAPICGVERVRLMAVPAGRTVRDACLLVRAASAAKLYPERWGLLDVVSRSASSAVARAAAEVGLRECTSVIIQ